VNACCNGKAAAGGESRFAGFFFSFGRKSYCLLNEKDVDAYFYEVMRKWRKI
jgi:hypothetical protein